MNGGVHILFLYNVLAANGHWLIQEFQNKGYSHGEVEFWGVVRIYKFKTNPKTFSTSARNYM